MKKLAIVCLLLFSVFSSAESAFEVLPLNSPVKESTANFHIKFNQNLEIEEVAYQIKNAGKIFEKPTNFQKVILSNGPEGKILKVNVSKLNPGFYQLFVKIKDKKRNEHFFKTKYKDHAMFVIDSSLEVPMPDPKKNNATIAGIDSDNDGIRDDVQRWINEEFKDQPKVKMAVRQLAVGRQNDLLSVENRQKSILAGRKMLSDLACLTVIAGLDERSRIDRELKDKLLNTKDRIYAEIKANANFSGQLWMLPNDINEERAMCNFDLNKL